LIIIENEDERIGSKGLESKLIGTASKCLKCKPSSNWIGNYSPKNQIRTPRFWIVQHLSADEITHNDMKIIEKLVHQAKNWMKIKLQKGRL
jgi:hypothetical protein